MTQKREHRSQPDLSSLSKEERAAALKALVEQGWAALVEELKQSHELQAGLDSRRRTKTLIREWGHELLHRQWMTIEDALARIPKPVRELQVDSVAYIVGRYLE